MNIKDIMTKEVKSLSPEDLVRDALEIILNMDISGLPVIDSEGKLVGMFTEKDVLKTVLPSYISQVGRFVYEEDPKNIKNKFALLSKIKVKEVMNKNPETIREDAAVCEAARIMLAKDVRRICVLNKDAKVAGIVARCDVVRALKQMA